MLLSAGQSCYWFCVRFEVFELVYLSCTALGAFVFANARSFDALAICGFCCFFIFV